MFNQRPENNLANTMDTNVLHEKQDKRMIEEHARY